MKLSVKHKKNTKLFSIMGFDYEEIKIQNSEKILLVTPHKIEICGWNDSKLSKTTVEKTIEW